MRCGDIDASGEIWVYRPQRHKNGYRGQDRIIYIGPRGQAVLQPFLVGLGASDFVFSPLRMMSERCRMLRQARKSKVPPSQYCRGKARPKKRPGEYYRPR